MPRRLVPAVLFLSMVMVAFALIPAATASTSTVAGGGSAREHCPRGTTAGGGLCVGSGPTATQAAEMVRSTIQDASLGAVVVGIWSNDKPVLVGALGESMTGVPATVDMHHRTGNITATMLTTALLQQVDQRKLSMSDKLSKWYPNLPSADAITLDMLAHSTSGYQHYPELDSFKKALYQNPFKLWKPDDLIAYGVAGGPLFTPGTNWKFSDTGLVILSQVLEKTTGRPVAQLIQTGVLDPLKMKDTTPPITAKLPEPVLHSYTDERGVWEDATFWDPSWTWYDGGMGSNQDDLRRFIEAVGKGTLLSKASHTAQLAPTTVGLDGNKPGRYYAMGIGVVNGWLFTNPSLQGYWGALGYLPDKGLTIVVYNTITPKADPEKAQATLLLVALSKLLAPDQPVNLG
jgi:D-alanyl-D-alanine carboxypeptidase